MEWMDRCMGRCSGWSGWVSEWVDGVDRWMDGQMEKTEEGRSVHKELSATMIVMVMVMTTMTMIMMTKH